MQTKFNRGNTGKDAKLDLANLKFMPLASFTPKFSRQSKGKMASAITQGEIDPKGAKRIYLLVCVRKPRARWALLLQNIPLV